MLNLARTINNHVDSNFNYKVLIIMTLSYTLIEKFNQSKIILSCDYVMSQSNYSSSQIQSVQTNQQVCTCSRF